MKLFVKPSSDATIYNYPELLNKNTGGDEIIEVSKIIDYSIVAPSFIISNLENDYTSSISRILIKFDLTDVSNKITQGIIQSPNFLLNLKSCHSSEILSEYYVSVYPVSQSWEEGVGRRYDEIYDYPGVTWKKRNLNSYWIDGVPTDRTGGGTYYTSSVATQSFSYQRSDLKIDVSNIVYQWLSGSIDNNGFIIKFPDDYEQNNTHYGVIQFYSKNTNTIYNPYLEVSWNDYSFSSGSLTQLSSSIDKTIFVSNMKNSYNKQSQVRFNVFVRELYPQKRYDTILTYSDNKFLSGSLYYKISDGHTGETIMGFDEYTRVSCDLQGHFFKLDMSNLAQQRAYKVSFKYEYDGIVEIYNSSNSFSIEF